VAIDAALRGYLLEESLAWLLRFTGYELLVHASEDPNELVMTGDTLLVRGRGARHQVDVLGEFPFTPAFSMPVRLFLEAKYHQQPCGLDLVRNAHGVVYDVNENFMAQPGSRPRQRYRYCYALFSASGFTAEAQKYALAHQISLVDLSGASFEWLLGAVGSTAWTLAQGNDVPRPFPVTWLRMRLRQLLETAPPNLLPQAPQPEIRFRQRAEPVIEQFVASLHHHSQSELLLGFPSAPFVLALAAPDHERFVSFAESMPDHAVRLRRVGSGRAAEWSVSPQTDGQAYELTFRLPEHIEDWISDNAGKERPRTAEVKQQFLAVITIYRCNEAGVRAYLLRYEPSSWSRG
jgi:hypothetical protein